MNVFSKDMEIARSILTMIALYSASLLETGKSKRMACSIISPIGDLSYSPSSTPVCHEVPSTFRVRQLELFSSISCCGISTKKSASTCPFNTR